MAVSRAFSTLVEMKAETLRAMVATGWFNEREIEYLELAGLDLDETGNNQEWYEILEPQRAIREPRQRRKPRRAIIMLSKPVKTIQDHLRF